MAATVCAMDPGCLKVDELDYEIRIRGVEPSGDVDAKRKILRGLFSQERADRSFRAISNPITFDNDYDAIIATLNDLKDVIEGYKSEDTNLHKRISSRLAHVSARINRLNIIEDEHRTKSSELFLKLLALEAEFSDKQGIVTSTPIKNVRLETMLADLHFSNVAGSSKIKPILPCKWNLSFSGINAHESVISFLEKVESFRISRGVSKDELLTCAGDLFKAKAWTWYNVNKANFTTWDDLVSKLKKDFLPYHYHEDLLEEINRRTQGHDEKVSQYICDMLALFNRLPEKPEDKVIINKIRRNLLPKYISHLALFDFDTIDELTEYCRRIEESLSWSERYRPPVTKKSQLLEPDLSYISANTSRSSYNNVSSLNMPTCWNCGLKGHHYNACTQRKTLFCFGCGTRGVVKSRCSTCQKNLSHGEMNPEHSVDFTKTPETFQFKKAKDISQIKNVHLKKPTDGGSGSSK